MDKEPLATEDKEILQQALTKISEERKVRLNDEDNSWGQKFIEQPNKEVINKFLGISSFGFIDLIGQPMALDDIRQVRTLMGTVDSVQGHENKIIILSTVRSNAEAKIGFLDELGRVLVSMSRQKEKIILIGDWSGTLAAGMNENLLRTYPAEKRENILCLYSQFIIIKSHLMELVRFVDSKI